MKSVDSNYLHKSLLSTFLLSRSKMQPKCNVKSEKINCKFLKNSFFFYMWKSYKHTRARNEKRTQMMCDDSHATRNLYNQSWSCDPNPCNRRVLSLWTRHSHTHPPTLAQNLTLPYNDKHTQRKQNIDTQRRATYTHETSPSTHAKTILTTNSFINV